MSELLGGLILAFILGYLAVMTFVMGAMSTERRWPAFLASGVFAAATLALVAFMFSHIHVEVRGA